jgi:hypothetical protein
MGGVVSQEYFANVFGEHWQDEYYIWDCAAGTGNLLANLTNKYNIWASTIDITDIRVIHNQIDTGSIKNLLRDHVFQFDFLNDDFFDKLHNKDSRRKDERIDSAYNAIYIKKDLGAIFFHCLSSGKMTFPMFINLWLQPYVHITRRGGNHPTKAYC